MTFRTEAINSSFVAPTPIKWRQPSFFGTSTPAFAPAKKASEEAAPAKTSYASNPFAVTHYSLDCPKRDYDTIDLLG